MIYNLDIEATPLTLENLSPMLEDKNVIFINRNRVPEVTNIIKQWIATTLHKHYGGEAKGMIEAQQHFFRFFTNSLLEDHQAILLTNNQNYGTASESGS